jgi:hypothetical protein
MLSFFEKFPKIGYDINRSGYSNFENVTNIFFRIGIIKNVLSNTTSYYVYELQEGETPEIIAEKVYGDAGAYWIILYANDIVDPQFDWPLDHAEFYKYIVGKYGSVPIAKTTIHHYEKVVERTNPLNNLTTETRFVVNDTKLTDNDLNVPYDYYEGEGSMSETQTYNTYNMDGTTITEIIHRNEVSNYDYEVALNDSKRLIKVIKKEYFSQIVSEFNKLTSQPVSYVRRVS